MFDGPYLATTCRSGRQHRGLGWSRHRWHLMTPRHGRIAEFQPKIWRMFFFLTVGFAVSQIMNNKSKTYELHSCSVHINDVFPSIHNFYSF